MAAPLRPHGHRRGRSDRADRVDRRSGDAVLPTRGTGLAKRVGIIKRLTRTEMVPIAAGFPFGLSLGGANLPLPSRSSLRC